MKKGTLFIIVLGLLIVGVFLYQKQQILQPASTSQEKQKLAPEISLNISSPNDRAVVTNSMITVSGQTVANADVNINDVETKADSNGRFSGRINLDEGENSIIVVANDAYGRSSEKEIIVTYEPAAESQ